MTKRDGGEIFMRILFISNTIIMFILIIAFILLNFQKFVIPLGEMNFGDIAIILSVIAIVFCILFWPCLYFISKSFFDKHDEYDVDDDDNSFLYFVLNLISIVHFVLCCIFTAICFVLNIPMIFTLLIVEILMAITSAKGIFIKICFKVYQNITVSEEDTIEQSVSSDN